MSRNSVVKSGVLQEEIETALRLWRKRWWGRLKLIPVRLDGTPAPEKLKHLQWFDLQSDDRWRQLAVEIRGAQRHFVNWWRRPTSCCW